MDDILVVDEELVDINYSHLTDDKKKKGGRYSNGKPPKNSNGKKKKIIIISSIAAAVVVALGITGFCIFGNNIAPEILNSEFVFSDGTTISGVSISGKTMEEAKSILTANKKSFIKPLDISVNTDGKLTTLDENSFEYTYNIDSVLDEVKRDQTAATGSTDATKSYSVTATATEESIEKNINSIAESTNKDAVNAKVSEFNPFDEKNRFEYQEAVDGKKLDVQDLTAQLKDAVWSGKSGAEIDSKVEKTKAKIQVSDIKKNVIKLSTYKTVSYNTANGTSNMKVSLSACNGSVIDPGAVWSFNECTGNSNLESNGYKSATVIENGKTTQGIGGGICQSSSTIYNAAIRANMDVEERYNHKWASSYVPTGLDATIDYGNLDLKLSNPTEYQMFLECKLVDTTLYVSFWGAKSSSYDEIKTHNELVEKGSEDYTVKAWRVYFKDGEEIDRESLGSSTYDLDNGYIFIAADNDSGSVDEDPPADKPDSTPESKPESSEKPQSSHKPSSSDTPSSSSKPNSSSSAPATKPRPTNPPTDPEPEPVVTDPISSDDPETE